MSKYLNVAFNSFHFLIFFSPAKLDPNSKAFDRLKKTKVFDPKRSSVLSVLNDQINGNFSVDISGITENRAETSGRKI